METLVVLLKKTILPLEYFIPVNTFFSRHDYVRRVGVSLWIIFLRPVCYTSYVYGDADGYEVRLIGCIYRKSNRAANGSFSSQGFIHQDLDATWHGASFNATG